jgi:hypothetical protein
MRIVDPTEWDLGGMRDRARARRLQEAPPPEVLVSNIGREARNAAISGPRSLTWQVGEVMAGHGRAIAVIPLERNTFDALFNGLSGYRAQYYLSVEDGIEFNRLLVDALIEAARLIHEREAAKLAWKCFQHSFNGPWSKVWIHCDSQAFMNAPRGELRPWRCAEDHPTSIGLCAPLPAETALDLKGTWVADADQSHRQDVDWKGDRALRLHERCHV